MAKNKCKITEKASRIKTKQPGVYRNETTKKYDVKYCCSLIGSASRAFLL